MGSRQLVWHRKSGWLLSIALLAAGFALTAPVSNPAALAACARQSGGSVCQNPDGWEWIYDASTGVFTKSRRGLSHGTDGSSYAYSYAPSCDGDTPDAVKLCGRALTACDVSDPGGILYDFWRQEVASDPGPPDPSGTVCFGGQADAVTLVQLGQALDEDVRDQLPSFPVSVQPSPTAIVNLPVIVSAPLEPAPNFDVQDPIPGHVSVTATYTWTFDDGATLTGIGRAYDGTDPRTAPDGYYLDHTFTRADGNGSVTLVVAWHAEFTADGGPAVALPDIITAPQMTRFGVHEIRAVLVSG
jgi:hypothetical protein